MGYIVDKVRDMVELSYEDVINKAVQLVEEGTDEIFLMSTAQIDKEYFMEVGSKVRKVIPIDMKMVANKLIEAGFTGVYHICRLEKKKIQMLNCKLE